MEWFMFAFLGAIFSATYYSMDKELLKRVDRYLIATGTFIVAAITLISISAIQGIPVIGKHFWPALLFSVILHFIAVIFYLESLTTTPISLSMPMLAFTPVFLIVTSFVMLGELPSMPGLAGILLIVFGSYTLYHNHQQKKLTDPFRYIMKHKGILYMLMVSFLFSITANIDKILVLNSDPYLGAGLRFLFASFIFLTIAIVKEERDIKPTFKKYYRHFTTIGFALAAINISINIAFTMAIVPYVISIKRMGILISVIFGGLFFHEKNMLRRMTAASLMVLGSILIILFQ
jgi:drug/metabolite transporter (DMT)-like permease